MQAAHASPETRSPRGLAIALVLAIFVLDQATKLWFLHGYDLRIHQPLTLAPFAELVVVWNRGISYGLFQQETELGRWILVVGSVVASLALGVWMLRTNVRFLALSLALIVGGALGNAVDRTVYGAVFDFVHLYWGRFSWYVFNVADAAIVAGVVGLLYDSLVLEPRRARRRAPSQESRDEG
ncbi:signal peptidase II [Salinarimonas sp.]|uniref:signal peptidase II n=1 Tax=Salinarimonas sp. TaxID=2766526 RepID=UPI0032D8E44B